MKTIFAILLLSVVSNAETVFLVNGKQSAPDVAAIAAMNSKNTILKCDEVVMKINDRGSLSIKKKDAAGNWKQVGK